MCYKGLKNYTALEKMRQEAHTEILTERNIEQLQIYSRRN
jgi:hypothetical protein